MGILGKVTRELAEERGPDVAHSIRVPADWLEDGRNIVVSLPRRLACADCEGGGCDRCGRSGAVVLRENDEPAEQLQVRLATGPQEAVQLLRIPESGGPALSSDQSRGCLMLRVESGELSRGVQLASIERDSAPGFKIAWRIWLTLPILLLLMWWLMRP